jgi:hypothetical protein
VLVFDAADGRPVTVLRSRTGIATRVFADRDVVYFGGTDGEVRAVAVGESRVLWSAPTGRTLGDGDVALGKSVVLAFGPQRQLLAFDRTSGRQVGSLTLDGEPQPGLRVQGGRLLLQLQRGRTRDLPVHDVLVAIDVATMTAAWEYVDSGVRPGQPGVDDLMVGLPCASGEVVLFR